MKLAGDATDWIFLAAYEGPDGVAAVISTSVPYCAPPSLIANSNKVGDVFSRSIDVPWIVDFRAVLDADEQVRALSFTLRVAGVARVDIFHRVIWCAMDTRRSCDYEELFPLRW